MIDFMIHLQVASQLEQDEPECTADGISDDISFTEAPRSISKSSLRSKASRTSITSATGSRVSETFTQEVHLHSNNNYYHTPSMNYNTMSCINLIITSIPLYLQLESQAEQSVPASGVPESVKDEISPEVKKCTGLLKCYSKHNNNIHLFFFSPQANQVELGGTPRSSSKCSIRSKASKTSLKSISSSKASLKAEASPEVSYTQFKRN